MLSIKILTTLSIVLSLAWIAEKIDTRVAGILAGMPLGALLVFSFVGYELGPLFVSEGAIFAIPGIAGTLTFAGIYYFISLKNIPFNPLISSFSGIIGYSILTFGLSHINFNLFTSLIFGLLTIAIFFKILQRIPNIKILTPIKLTINQIILRGFGSSTRVIIITEASEYLGPKWSGLLVGFPITFLPFILIIHMTYSREHAHTIIRNFPIGLGSLVSFLTVIPLIMPQFGVTFGIIFSFLASLLYLTIFIFIPTLKKLK
jgi:hypothetical protein